MSLTDEKLRWLAIDFDNFIAETSGYPDYNILSPIKGAVEFLQQLEKDGWKIIIHTARPWADYEKIEKWLYFHNAPHRRIVCGKLLAKYYLDDRNIPFESFDEMYKKIK